MNSGVGTNLWGMMLGREVATNRINREFQAASYINRGIADAVNRNHGAFGDGLISPDCLHSSPISGADLAERVQKGLYAQGYINGTLLSEIARVASQSARHIDEAANSQRNALKAVTQKSREAINHTLEASQRYTDARADELMQTLRTNSTNHGDQILNLNRAPQLRGQLSAGVRAVSDNLGEPVNPETRAALQRLSAENERIIDQNGEIDCISSRFDRLAYLIGRNSAFGVAQTHNLKSDVLDAIQNTKSFSAAASRAAVRVTEERADTHNAAARQRELVVNNQIHGLGERVESVVAKIDSAKNAQNQRFDEFEKRILDKLAARENEIDQFIARETQRRQGWQNEFVAIREDAQRLESALDAERVKKDLNPTEG